MRKQHRQPKHSAAAPPSRRQLRHAAYLAEWQDVDWTKQNVELARERGLTSERIRQVRQMLSQRPSPRHGRQHTTRTALRWAEKNLPRIRGLTYQEVQTRFGRPINRCGPLYLFLKEHRVLRDGRVIHPWEEMNFALPSRELGRIWRLPFNMAASYRYRKHLPEPRWSFKGGLESLPLTAQRRAFQRAIRLEEAKARAFFARTRRAR